jgi:long-chain acyl-CoA synthetase
VTVAAALLAHARRAPERRAVTVGNEHVSYAQLAAGIETYAAWLYSRCAPGARVGVMLPTGRAFLEVFLGAGQAGMAAMVLHPGWSERERRLALDAGRPELIVTTPELAARFGAELPATRIVEIDVAPPGVVAPPGPRVCETPPRPDDAATFYVGFTSGTTDGPKGFVRDHRSWLRSFDACGVFGIAADDEVAVPGDLAHSLFLFAALHALSVGAGVHLQPRFDASALARMLDEVPITRLYLVPTMLAGLLATPAAGSERRSTRLRSVISSGAPWPAAALGRVTARFPGVEVIDFYGSSEASFVSYRRVRADDPPTELGQLFPGVEARVGDARMSDGTGRLWVRSGMLFSGYLDADATAEVRDAEGFVTTGDVVTLDAGHGLQLVGRVDTMLICGGVNVHPEQVERVLERHPQVLEAVVVAAPDPVWGQVPWAVLRVAGPDRPSRGELRIHCRERLSGAARPRRFLVVDAPPRTPNAKTDRRVLAAQVADGTITAELLR